MLQEWFIQNEKESFIKKHLRDILETYFIALYESQLYFVASVSFNTKAFHSQPIRSYTFEQLESSLLHVTMLPYWLKYIYHLHYILYNVWVKCLKINGCIDQYWLQAFCVHIYFYSKSPWNVWEKNYYISMGCDMPNITFIDAGYLTHSLCSFWLK